MQDNILALTTWFVEENGWEEEDARHVAHYLVTRVCIFLNRPKGLAPFLLEFVKTIGLNEKDRILSVVWNTTRPREVIRVQEGDQAITFQGEYNNQYTSRDEAILFGSFEAIAIYRLPVIPFMDDEDEYGIF